jgi:hypothetical protein
MHDLVARPRAATAARLRVQKIHRERPYGTAKQDSTHKRQDSGHGY